MERIGPELPKCSRCKVPTSVRFNLPSGYRFGRRLPDQHVCPVCWRKFGKHQRGRQGRLIPRSQVIPEERAG